MAESTVIEGRAGSPPEPAGSRPEPVEGPRLHPLSPAAHLAERFAAAEVTGPRAVRIREVSFLTMVGVRAEPGSSAAERIGARLGVPLPSTCGAVSRGDGVSVLWLAPDEFLVVSDEPSADLTSTLVEALDGAAGSATDLSANRTTFALSGPAAREVLEKGCPLDLHPRTFKIGTAYVTLIGSVPVILEKIAEETYRVLPRSSFADFLGRWLVDAMAEFKASEVASWR